MSDENKYATSDIIDFAALQNPLEIKSALDNLMLAKVHAEITDKKIEIAKNMFGVESDNDAPDEEDMAEIEDDEIEDDEDIEGEEESDDDFDLDISDEELEELLNDLEDLDDTDLDDDLEDDNLDSEEEDNGENA
jgi:hypothetical protein